MKQFLITMAVLLGLFIPVSAVAQPAPPPVRVEHCYTVLLPFPHTQCEYRYVRPVPPSSPRHHYAPAPPPPRHHGPDSRGHGPSHHGHGGPHR